MKHSIVIVDDHILIAKALSGIIGNFEEFEVLYECENGRDLQARFAGGKIPDIILLDISMPEMDGFETAAWLKEKHPAVLVMALSMQDDEQSLIKMIRSGARGYLLKNVHPEELQRALKSLLINGSYYPDWATAKVFMNISSGSDAANTTILITEREKEFLRYSISEMSYKEIAAEMFCSPRTVESYRDSLFEKLGLRSRVGLAVYAIRNGYDKKAH